MRLIRRPARNSTQRRCTAVFRADEPRSRLVAAGRPPARSARGFEKHRRKVRRDPPCVFRARPQLAARSPSQCWSEKSPRAWHGRGCRSVRTPNSGCQSLRNKPLPSRSSGNSMARAGARHKASRIIGPCASKLVTGRSQTRAAAASNSRPAALVSGQLTLFRQAASARPSGSGQSGHGSSHSQCSAAALRQGSRPARSPPGSLNVRKLATRCQLPALPSSASPPQSVSSSPRPTPSQANMSHCPG